MDPRVIYSTTAIAISQLTGSFRVSVGANKMVRVWCANLPVWVKIGTSTVTATEGTSGEFPVGTGSGYVDFVTYGTQTHIALIEDSVSAAFLGGHAVAAVSLIG